MTTRTRPGVFASWRECALCACVCLAPWLVVVAGVVWLVVGGR